MSEQILTEGPLVPALLALLEEPRHRARDIVMVADPTLVALGRLAPLERALAGTGRSADCFTSFSPNPSLGQVRDLAARLRGRSPIVVIIGGGSALDTGKLAAVLAGADDDLPSVLGVDLSAIRRPSTLIAIPSTAGTGAEATRTAVVSDDEMRKRWAWGEGLRPDAVILDPALLQGLPPKFLVWTGLDALVHAIEAASHRWADTRTKAWACDAISIILAALPACLDDPRDEARRQAMLQGAYLAGRAIDRAGTGAAHAISHGMASVIECHHGAVVAAALAVCLRANLVAAAESFVEVATRFGVIPADLPLAYERFLDRVGFEWPALVGADGERALSEVMAEDNRPMRDHNAARFEAEDYRRFIERLTMAQGASGGSA